MLRMLRKLQSNKRARCCHFSARKVRKEHVGQIVDPNKSYLCLDRSRVQACFDVLVSN